MLISATTCKRSIACTAPLTVTLVAAAAKVLVLEMAVAVEAMLPAVTLLPAASPDVVCKTRKALTPNLPPPLLKFAAKTDF